MNPFEEIYKKTSRLTDEFLGKVFFSSKKVKALIISLNTDGQLFAQGVDSKNDKLPLYVQGSKFGKGGSPYDLKDTGDLYKTWVVTFDEQGNGIITANTLKNGFDIQKISSSHIVGLTDDSFQKLEPIALKIVSEVFEKALFSI